MELVAQDVGLPESLAFAAFANGMPNVLSATPAPISMTSAPRTRTCRSGKERLYAGMLRHVVDAGLASDLMYDWV